MQAQEVKPVAEALPPGGLRVPNEVPRQLLQLLQPNRQLRPPHKNLIRRIDLDRPFALACAPHIEGRRKWRLFLAALVLELVDRHV